MANWCINYITICNDDKKELEKLQGLIDEWTSKNYRENPYGLQWLGNVVGNSGVDTWSEEKGEFTSTKTRGWIEEMELTDDALLLQASTAWSPMVQLWDKVVKKYSKDSVVLFSAEETGEEIYETNDCSYQYLYFIDSCIDEIESDREATEDDVVEVIQKVCHTKETDINILLDIFEKADFNNIWIHKWDFVDISECY